MLSVGAYEFKIAETAEELEQVHRLNYRTFVQEIPQHTDPGTGVLVDKFHRKNSYIIGLRDGRVVAMLAFHDEPPFSVAGKLANPEVLSGLGARPLEVRLLALEPGERESILVVALMYCLDEHARGAGYTHMLISGVVEQQKFYEKIGFEPLGPPMGVGRACFIPMWATLDRIQEALERTKQLWAKRLERKAAAG